MELKVWTDGVQRVVCGVCDVTTCHDVILAMARATGRTGRFTLLERCRGADRRLAPGDCPLRILQAWGERAADIQFVLRFSSSSSGGDYSRKSNRVSGHGLGNGVSHKRDMHNGLVNGSGLGSGQSSSPGFERRSDRSISDHVFDPHSSRASNHHSAHPRSKIPGKSREAGFSANGSSDRHRIHKSRTFSGVLANDASFALRRTSRGGGSVSSGDPAIEDMGGITGGVIVGSGAPPLRRGGGGIDRSLESSEQSSMTSRSSMTSQGSGVFVSPCGSLERRAPRRPWAPPPPPMERGSPPSRVSQGVDMQREVVNRNFLRPPIVIDDPVHVDVVNPADKSSGIVEPTSKSNGMYREKKLFVASTTAKESLGKKDFGSNARIIPVQDSTALNGLRHSSTAMNDAASRQILSNNRDDASNEKRPLATNGFKSNHVNEALNSAETNESSGGHVHVKELVAMAEKNTAAVSIGCLSNRISTLRDSGTTPLRNSFGGGNPMRNLPPGNSGSSFGAGTPLNGFGMGNTMRTFGAGKSKNAASSADASQNVGEALYGTKLGEGSADLVDGKIERTQREELIRVVQEQQREITKWELALESLQSDRTHEERTKSKDEERTLPTTESKRRLQELKQEEQELEEEEKEMDAELAELELVSWADKVSLEEQKEGQMRTELMLLGSSLTRSDREVTRLTRLISALTDELSAAGERGDRRRTQQEELDELRSRLKELQAQSILSERSLGDVEREVMTSQRDVTNKLFNLQRLEAELQLTNESGPVVIC